MTRGYRPVPRGQEQHLAGVRALSDGICVRCDEPVLKEQRIVRTRDGWMHVSCASGFNE